MILKKYKSPDLNILWISEQVNWEVCEQDPPIHYKTLNTEKEESPNQNEMQNIKNQNATHTSSLSETMRYKRITQFKSDAHLTRRK